LNAITCAVRFIYFVRYTNHQTTSKPIIEIQRKGERGGNEWGSSESLGRVLDDDLSSSVDRVRFIVHRSHQQRWLTTAVVFPSSFVSFVHHNTGSQQLYSRRRIITTHFFQERLLICHPLQLCKPIAPSSTLIIPRRSCVYALASISRRRQQQQW
jgi:hypothetical protein